MIFRKKDRGSGTAAPPSKVSFSPGTVVRDGSSGRSVLLPRVVPARASDGGDPASYWVELQGGGAGGFYAYRLCVRDPSTGAWGYPGQHGVLGGTGDLAPAHEVNDTVGLPNKRFRAWPTPGTFAVEFQAEECSPGV